MSADLDRFGGGVAGDSGGECFHARWLAGDGIEILAANAGNDHGVPAAGKLAGGIDRPARNTRGRAAEIGVAATAQPAAHRGFDDVTSRR